MKKFGRLLLLVLASVGLLLGTNVNAESYGSSNEPEEVKKTRQEAIERIKGAIPDNLTLNIKESDAIAFDAKNENHKVSMLATEKIKESLAQAGIKFPMNLEATDDNGEKVKITIDEPMALLQVFDIDMKTGKYTLFNNVNTLGVEMMVTTNYSGSGSAIVEYVKPIKVTYSDSNKKNAEDKKYVSNKVKDEKYQFISIREFNFNNDNMDDFDSKSARDIIIAQLNATFNDSTLEYKFYYLDPMGKGDVDFSDEGWVICVFKNGIAYKTILVESFNTYKITIPESVVDTNESYLEYVGNLFSKTSLGKPTSIKFIDDIKNHIEDIAISDKNYYEFTFGSEKYAFKLVKSAANKPIISIKVNKTSLSMVKGKTEKLVTTINPSDTTDDKTLTWTSSNTKVATVDKAGNVKAVGEGTATITVKTSNGKTATVKVTVTNPNAPITSVKINQGNISVGVNKTGKLTATINPSNTTQSKTLTWTSSNKKIATVDKNGNVKGIKAGTANITVKTSNGKTATIKVTVTKPTPIKSVKLNKKTLKLELNKTYQLKATINPSSTTDSKVLSWSTSNKKVAIVDKNGKITAVGGGSATITVKTANGKKAKVKVTVSKINAKKATIAAIKNQIQTGKALKPSVQVKLNGKVLKNGKDYTVTYKNNKKAGKATVTVKFKGNYTGTKTGSFIIFPSKVNIKNPSTSKKSITVKYSKVSGAKYYQTAYRLKGTNKWSYTTKSKISKLTSGKEYEVMIRAGIKNGKNTIYGTWSNVKTIKVK